MHPEPNSQDKRRGGCDLKKKAAKPPLTGAAGHERSECEPDRAKARKEWSLTIDCQSVVDHFYWLCPVGLAFAPSCPSAPPEVASHLFANGAATPPFQGGEFPAPSNLFTPS